MKNSNIKNPLARPWLFAILLICFAFSQLLSTLLISIHDSTPNLVFLDPSINLSLILWAIAIASSTPELHGLKIIQLPIYLFMMVQMFISLFPYPHLTGISTLIQIPPLLATVSGLAALIQLSIIFRKYF